MPPDLSKLLERLEREIWKQVSGLTSGMPGILNSPPIARIEPLFFEECEKASEFRFIANMNFGVNFIEPRYAILTTSVDDCPRPARMPFDVFAALDVLWLRIELDLFDRRLPHVISKEIT